MAPVMMENPKDMKCFLNEVVPKLRKRSILFLKGSYIIFYIFLAAYNYQVHLPISDEGCPGKLTWCGGGKPISPEVVNELQVYIYKRKASHLYCLHIWTGSPAEKRFGLHYDGCDTNVTEKLFICEIPEI